MKVVIDYGDVFLDTNNDVRIYDFGSIEDFDEDYKRIEIYLRPVIVNTYGDVIFAGIHDMPGYYIIAILKVTKSSMHLKLVFKDDTVFSIEELNTTDKHAVEIVRYIAYDSIYDSTLEGVVLSDKLYSEIKPFIK